MYRKFVWCYVFVLTLLDISLNTKLTAQGKSHGVSVHDSLVEGITFQEWGAAQGAGGAGAGAGAAEGGAVRLSPGALVFGRAALGAAHAATVTLTNTANTTLHLASVAGTTPDFHASFFDSKTLAPDANTTFSVVYLGRREGPVAAHLYIHTSQGVHKYPVSAVGVASAWGIWPLAGLRVPLNATLSPLLTLTNPTSHVVQVQEVYSSGAWLGLQLPEGQSSAGRALWSIPPRATRPLVRLRLQPPPAPPHDHHALTAYIRIKTNATGGSGGGGGGGESGDVTDTLVVGVEARAVPAGEYALPVQLRLSARGSLDPPLHVSLSLGNSEGAAVHVSGAVWGARCHHAAQAQHDPRSDPHPHPQSAAASLAPDPSAPAPPAHHNGNGGGKAPAPSEGATVTVLQSVLPPHLPPTEAALLTLDYGKLWSSYEASRREGEEGDGEGSDSERGGEAWCGGWAVLGRAAVPYSVRLLRGTLRADPAELHFITANRETALQPQELRVRNEFLVPVHLTHLDVPPEVHQHFVVEGWAERVVEAAQSAAVVSVRLRDASPAPDLRLRTALRLRTNVTEYTVPLLLYSGRLHLEWEWPHSADGWLRVGAVGTSSTRRVRALLRNPAPAPLCATALRAALPGAHLALRACADHRAAPHDHACRCVPAESAAPAWLTVVAPARAGALAGTVRVSTPHASTDHNVTLTAVQGRLAARPLHLRHAAPYAWSTAELVLENTMELRMRVTEVLPQEPDPALEFLPEAGAEGAWVRAGVGGVGQVRYRPERLCEPACYTGLQLHTAEGAAWLSRDGSTRALQADLALLRARRAQFAALAPHRHTTNLSLHLHTTQVVQVPVEGWVRAVWPRLSAGGAGGAAAGGAGLAGVGGRAALRLLLANPSPSHSLLLQPVLGPPPSDNHYHNASSEEESLLCMSESCVYSADAFTLGEWRATAGEVREWAGGAGAGGAGAGGAGRGNASLPMLLLAPAAQLELKVVFAPREPAAFLSYLYLRNNLTVVEVVPVTGRGAFPSFELAGRRPGSADPLLFDVSTCAGAVRRSVVVRNTGRVAVRLREWRVAGRPCEARGFRVAPCAPLSLAPNESRAIELAFAPDWSLARHRARLTLRTDLGAGEFLLHAAAPARLLADCARRAPRPPWEPALRAAGTLLALALAALVLAAAALDAERVLRRARAARSPAPAPPDRAPLDLRALAAPAPPAAPPRAPPASAPRRRRTRKVDPAAESRAFERWRAGLRRAEDESSRSSEDADNEETSHTAAEDAPLLDGDAFEPAETDPPAYEPEEDATRDDPEPAGEEDSASTGSGSSSPVDHDDRDSGEERDDGDEHEDSGSGDAAPRSSPADEHPPAPRPPRPAPLTPPAGAALDAQGRTGRARRDPDAPRRSERRPEDASRPRTLSAKHNARKDKPSKRRERAPPATPPRASPPRAAGPPPPQGAGGPGGAGARWGAASWSAVVARGGGSLAPIGSDLRRRLEAAQAQAPPDRAPARRPDDSLFYFNGDQTCARPDRDFGWRPPPVVERPSFVPTNTRDYIEEPASAGGAFGSIGAGGVWGGALASRAPGAWPWGSYGPGTMRPPPGFGTTPAANVGVVGSAVGAVGTNVSAVGTNVGAVGTNVGAVGTNVGAVGTNVGAVGTNAGGAAGGGVRAFDPFHSLASIWTRTALDWRRDEDN